MLNYYIFWFNTIACAFNIINYDNKISLFIGIINGFAALNSLIIFNNNLQNK